MAQTIGNPLSWTAQALRGAASHVTHSAERIGGDPDETPSSIEICDLTVADLRDALRLGMEDFGAARADVIMLAAIYPVIGLILVSAGLNMALLPLIFPALAGFALLGPLAAVGLYEMSRLREAGEAPRWGAALALVGQPRFSALLVLGLLHVALFGAWLAVAWLIWVLTLGPVPPESIPAFLTAIFTTGAGWAMLILGVAAGFCFAVVVLATSVVSFPMLLDHNVGVPRAIWTSVAVARRNPRVIATWGLIVAGALVLGTVPLLIGLVVALPLLGHATWHLYRRAVRYG